MNIRELVPGDAYKYLRLLKRLDGETEFMLYKKGERLCNQNDVVGHLKSVGGKINQVVAGAFDDQLNLVGYMSLFGGKQIKIAHVATLSVGVLRDFQGKGIASELWNWCKLWMKRSGVEVVELTVMARNCGAIRLYKKWGFRLCGVYVNRIKIDDKYEDEFIMEYVNGTVFHTR